ncbi:MAG TPA: energy transducer TonB [Pyrinomonadaceae bacterium]|nr:energy transducer TonB [Pyrinomonadaceae bacterium]
MQLTHLKSLTFNFRLALSALLCCVVFAATASAQEEAARTWVKVAPRSEAFTVMMPRSPLAEVEKQTTGGSDMAGNRYRVKDSANFTYAVWSFKINSLPARLRRASLDGYLDLCGELAWDMLIEPERDARVWQPTEAAKYWLAYDAELSSESQVGRNYWLRLGGARGAVRAYATNTHIYLVGAWGEDETAPSIEHFLKSFALPAATRGSNRGEGTAGVSREKSNKQSPDTTRGVTQATNYNRVFSAKEVTQKASVNAKPEPLYTEWARRFQITGTVRLRLVLGASGEVEGIAVAARLAHGLTDEAIKAARRVSFTPAVKDGRPVSQYITIEYNFNIY